MRVLDRSRGPRAVFPAWTAHPPQLCMCIPLMHMGSRIGVNTGRGARRGGALSKPGFGSCAVWMGRVRSGGHIGPRRPRRLRVPHARDGAGRWPVLDARSGLRVTRTGCNGAAVSTVQAPARRDSGRGWRPSPRGDGRRPPTTTRPRGCVPRGPGTGAGRPSVSAEVVNPPVPVPSLSTDGR